MTGRQQRPKPQTNFTRPQPKWPTQLWLPDCYSECKCLPPGSGKSIRQLQCEHLQERVGRGSKGQGSPFPQQRKQCKSISKSIGQDLANASLVTSSKQQKQGLSGDTGHAQELKVQRLKGPLMDDWTWKSAHRECQSIFNRKRAQHMPGHAEWNTLSKKDMSLYIGDT